MPDTIREIAKDEKRFQELTPEEVAALPEFLQKVCEGLEGKLPMAFTVHRRMEEVIRERLINGEITVDVNGHYQSGSLVTNHPYRDPMTLEEWLKDEMLGMCLRFEDVDFEKISEFISNPDPERDEWAILHKGSCLKQCPLCGEDIAWETNGSILRIASECPYPEGAVYSWELNVPSGKIVVANDLRDKFIIMEDFNVNALEGCIQTSFKYSSVGMSHGYVGNSCPGVHKKSDSEFLVGNFYEPDEDDDDEDDEDGKYKSGLDHEFEGTKQVASICTDLWWYSIVDYDQFVERYGEPKDNAYIEVVDCEPGVYEFLHVGNVLDTDKNPTIYTYFNKVREPDPVIDYKEEFDSLDLTAEQCLHNIMKDYYMGSDKLYESISTMMCCYGTGAAFHPNGFFYSSYNKELTNEEPEADIPFQLEQYAWYPFCEEYSPVGLIASGKVKASDSFIKLSFNVLHSIVTTPPNDNYHTASSVKLGEKMLNKLYKREKELAPDYVDTYLKKAKAKKARAKRAKAKKALAQAEKAQVKKPSFASVGTEVIWDDDGAKNYGVVTTVIPQTASSSATHKGNLYVVTFQDEEDGEYTRNFDDYDFFESDERIEIV